MLGSMLSWIWLAMCSSVPILSFSAVTRRTSPTYSTVLWDSLAKDSASTSISSSVRYSSSIVNSRLVSLRLAILFVIRFRGRTILLPRMIAEAIARITTAKYTSLIVILILPIFER